MTSDRPSLDRALLLRREARAGVLRGRPSRPLYDCVAIGDVKARLLEEQSHLERGQRVAAHAERAHQGGLLRKVLHRLLVDDVRDLAVALEDHDVGNP